MKKLLFVMLSFLVGTGAMAGEKDEYFTLNAGFLFNSTLNATLGYEHELTYGNAVELTAEIGNQWRVWCLYWQILLCCRGWTGIQLCLSLWCSVFIDSEEPG